MKYKLEKLKLGSVVVITDARGNTAKAKVTDLSEEAMLFHLRLLEDADLYVRVSDGAPVPHKTGAQVSFYKSGHYYSGFVDGLRVTEIKKPWKKFEGELQLGMKVRVRTADTTNGKYVKGVVVIDEHGGTCVDFERQMEIFPGLQFTRLKYLRDGNPIILGSNVYEQAGRLNFKITHRK